MGNHRKSAYKMSLLWNQQIITFIKDVSGYLVIIHRMRIHSENFFRNYGEIPPHCLGRKKTFEFPSFHPKEAITAPVPASCHQSTAWFILDFVLRCPSMKQTVVVSPEKKITTFLDEIPHDVAKSLF